MTKENKPDTDDSSSSLTYVYSYLHIDHVSSKALLYKTNIENKYNVLLLVKQHKRFGPGDWVYIL